MKESLTFNDELGVGLGRLPSSWGQFHLAAVHYARQVQEDSLDAETEKCSQTNRGNVHEDTSQYLMPPDLWVSSSNCSAPTVPRGLHL